MASWHALIQRTAPKHRQKSGTSKENNNHRRDAGEGPLDHERHHASKRHVEIDNPNLLPANARQSVSVSATFRGISARQNFRYWRRCRCGDFNHALTLWALNFHPRRARLDVKDRATSWTRKVHRCPLPRPFSGILLCGRYLAQNNLAQ
jgi:hypothetical protein